MYVFLNCTGMYMYRTEQECMCFELYSNARVLNCTGMYVYRTEQQCTSFELYINVSVLNCAGMDSLEVSLI